MEYSASTSAESCTSEKEKEANIEILKYIRNNYENKDSKDLLTDLSAQFNLPKADEIDSQEFIVKEELIEEFNEQMVEQGDIDPDQLQIIGENTVKTENNLQGIYNLYIYIYIYIYIIGTLLDGIKNIKDVIINRNEEESTNSIWNPNKNYNFKKSQEREWNKKKHLFACNSSSTDNLNDHITKVIIFTYFDYLGTRQIV